VVQEEALGQRAFLMEHPDLIAMTSQMWQELDTVVDDSGSGELFLLEEQYIGMHRYVALPFGWFVIPTFSSSLVVMLSLTRMVYRKSFVP
jgi:hypothetical protein